MSQTTQNTVADQQVPDAPVGMDALQDSRVTFELGPNARLFPLEALAGQPQDSAYAFVDRGLPMPAEGVA